MDVRVMFVNPRSYFEVLTTQSMPEGLSSLVITSIMSSEGNLNDSKTIESFLDQHEFNGFYLPKEIVYDLGGRAQKRIGNSNRKERIQVAKMIMWHD